MNKANFKRNLKSFIENSVTARDILQELLEFSFQQINDHGSLTHLNQTFSAAVSVRSVRTATVKAYIQASIPNIKLTKKDGFIRDNKKEKLQNTWTKQDKPWYGFDNAGQAVPDMKDGQVISLLTRINTALDSGKAEHPEHLEQVRAVLTPIVESWKAA